MNEPTPVSRRDFLRTGAVAAAAAAVSPRVAPGEEPSPASPSPDQKAKPAPLTRRKLGRTDLDVTILSQGAGFDIGDRHLNLMHEEGINVLDTSAYYLMGNAERTIGQWLNETGRRKQYIVIDKDKPLTPKQLAEMIDRRLETLQTDYLDLFLLGAMGDSGHYHGLDDAKWFNDRSWIEATEQLRKSGKCRFFGFSTHTEPIDIRTGLLNAAAQGGWVDAIMVSADPLVLRDNAPFAKAVDACHKAGVGLICMKENRSGPESIKEVWPGFEKKGLNAFTAVLTAMWTDERFATVTSHMNTIQKLRENATACRNYQPLTAGELSALDTMLRGAKRRFCQGCEGRCRRAAGTSADLNTIARYVNYAEQDGRLREARQALLNLPPEARDWSGADLAAAQQACNCHLDFASILKRAERLMA